MKYLILVLLRGLRNLEARRVPAYAPVISGRFKARWR